MRNSYLRFEYLFYLFYELHKIILQYIFTVIFLIYNYLVVVYWRNYSPKLAFSDQNCTPLPPHIGRIPKEFQRLLRSTYFPLISLTVGGVNGWYIVPWFTTGICHKTTKNSILYIITFIIKSVGVEVRCHMYEREKEKECSLLDKKLTR